MRNALILGTLSVCVVGCWAEADPVALDPALCDLETYRVISADVPTQSQEVSSMSIDLDGDGVPDNSGGGILALLISNFETAQTALPEQINTRLPTDEAPWFLVVNRCPDAKALLWALRGQDLDGDGIYTLAARNSPPALGEIRGSVISVRGGGFGEIPIGLFADPLGTANEIWSAGAGLAADLELVDGILTGTIAMGVSGAYADIVGRPLAEFLTSRLQAGTSPFAEEIDADNDRVVSLEEFKNNSLIRATLLSPDLDLLSDDRYDPDNDGVPESLSFGFTIRAAPAQINW